MKLWSLTGLLFFIAPVARAATRADLKNEINELVKSIGRESSQNIEVINAITMAIAPPLSLTVGTVEGTQGSPVDIPVYLKAGSSPVSALQFDVMGASEFSIAGADPGIAALAAGKSCQVAPITGGYRVILFGLNANAITSGPVAVIKADIGPEVTRGKKVAPISAISASSPSGTNVALTGKNGSLTVR